MHGLGVYNNWFIPGRAESVSDVMGDWQQILFERRVLTWTTLLVFLGTGLWITALATPYWLIHIPVEDERIIWGHSGIWQKCELVEENAGLQWECWDSFKIDSTSFSVILRSELSLSGVTLLLTMGALIFSWYSINHPKYTYRRLAAVLHLLVAASLLAVIQLVDSDAHHALHAAHADDLLYGYSYLLARSCKYESTYDKFQLPHNPLAPKLTSLTSPQPPTTPAHSTPPAPSSSGAKTPGRRSMGITRCI